MSNFDWTNVIILLIGILVAVIEELLRKKFIPWLKQQNLMKAAQAAVDLAEAIIGRGDGPHKFEIALRLLEEKGYAIDAQAVLDAIQNAWKKLDLRMIENGEKEAAE